MLRILSSFLLVPLLVALGLVVALFAYMVHGERSAKERATRFCDAVRVGDDPIEVHSRASRSGAIGSPLAWMPPDGRPRTLEVLFKGGIPLSAHGCRIQAAEKVTAAVYFHTR